MRESFEAYGDRNMKRYGGKILGPPRASHQASNPQGWVFAMFKCPDKAWKQASVPLVAMYDTKG